MPLLPLSIHNCGHNPWKKKTVAIILVANFMLIIRSLFHFVNDVNASNALNNWSKSSPASSLNTHSAWTINNYSLFFFVPSTISYCIDICFGFAHFMFYFLY